MRIVAYMLVDDAEKNKIKDKGFFQEIVLGNLVIMRLFVHLSSEKISEYISSLSHPCFTYFVHPFSSFEDLCVEFLTCYTHT